MVSLLSPPSQLTDYSDSARRCDPEGRLVLLPSSFLQTTPRCIRYFATDHHGTIRLFSDRVKDLEFQFFPLFFAGQWAPGLNSNGLHNLLFYYPVQTACYTYSLGSPAMKVVRRLSTVRLRIVPQKSEFGLPIRRLELGSRIGDVRLIKQFIS